MGVITSGELGTEIPDIPIDATGDDLGQVQKLVFQPLRKADGTFNAFVPNHATTPTTPTLLADWTALFAASDLTKPTISPFLSTPENEPGEKREFGGGNQTVNGIPLVMGRNASSFSGMFYAIKQATIKVLKGYIGDAIGVYLIDEHGNIAGVDNGLASDNAAYEIRPIPIYSFFVSDKKLGQFEEPDGNAFDFKFRPNWSDNLTVLTPTDFDALSDLKTAV